MKHLKFTYVDALTGISISTEPAMNGTKFPDVPGLAFHWARESAYPTPTPEFFGTCPDDSATQVDGVLGVFVESDWEQMRTDEMRARSPIPQSVSMRQAELALLDADLLDDIEALIPMLPRSDQISWKRASVVERSNPLVAYVQQTKGMTDAQIDALFVQAATL